MRAKAEVARLANERAIAEQGEQLAAERRARDEAERIGNLKDDSLTAGADIPVSR